MTRIHDIEPDFYGIVFCRTKIGVDEVATRLVAQGYSAEGLHGDVSQAQREKILRKFRDKAVNILVATDVAARGIDVSNLSHVINYSLPQDSESYDHRIRPYGPRRQPGYGHHLHFGLPNCAVSTDDARHQGRHQAGDAAFAAGHRGDEARQDQGRFAGDRGQ